MVTYKLPHKNESHSVISTIMALLSHFSLLLAHYSIYQTIYNTAIADILIQYRPELELKSFVVRYFFFLSEAPNLFH